MRRPLPRTLGSPLAPVAAGALLRLWNLPRQVLGGDELHGVRTALGEPLSGIFTAYGKADPGVPLAMFYRLLLQAGLPLSELALRGLPLLAGLAAPLLLPWALAHRLERRERLVFAWLLAVAPLLVLYSRIARPYAPVVLLGLLAVAAFDRWWRDGDARWGGLYVLLAPVTVWLHLLAAPLVLAPLPFAAVAAVARRRGGGRWGSLLLLGGAVLLLLGLLLLPARESLLTVAAAKSGEGRLEWTTVAAALRLQAGSAGPAPTAVAWAVLFWAAALAGLVLLLRRDRPFGLYGLALAAVHLAAVAALGPFAVDHPLVFNRYVLVLLPWFLAWAAVAVTALGRWFRRRRGRGEAALPALFLLLALAAGPLLRSDYRASSFVQHNDFVQFDRPPAAPPPDATPAFYRRIPAPGDLVEYPWPSAWRLGRSFYAYQRLHRRRVLVSSPEAWLADRRLDLRNHVAPRPRDLLASGARYLVIHRDLAAEERALVDAAEPRGGVPPARGHRLRRAAARLARELRQRWGEPLYEDRSILVWELAPKTPRPSPGTEPGTPLATGTSWRYER